MTILDDARLGIHLLLITKERIARFPYNFYRNAGNFIENLEISSHAAMVTIFNF